MKTLPVVNNNGKKLKNASCRKRLVGERHGHSEEMVQ
ncbi:hypothetical protein BvCmsKKP043_03701 [Escherichia coli]|nr:hypothetical protein JI426_003371 [Escherichia coli O22:H8]BDW06551.1 hypothetical protein F02E060_2661 [Escherichia coli]GDG32582.1 hypothetical protein BvCmsKKP043_03701 [Escherichia coli]GDG51836.1 hypothetical protein BvCmsKKP015_00653 [Escherichia coli]GDI99680.1 hypothetical protein BvCmsKKP001_01050 [Escherichia coli]